MSKHDTTLASIFTNPVRANVKWADIESLFVHYGGEIEKRSGSRVRVYLNGVRANFHRPHPSTDTDKGAVKSVRTFLKRAKVVS